MSELSVELLAAPHFLLLEFLKDFLTSLKFTQYFEQMQRAIAPQKILT
ncbi:MAG: hypothetical protein RM022_030440 [Nostoc sp. EfeVER01]|nr:hypothetical protein [Nostoc sp. EfeVER01]